MDTSAALASGRIAPRDAKVSAAVAGAAAATGVVVLALSGDDD